MPVHTCTDKQRGQQGKDKCLKKRSQYFKHIDHAGARHTYKPKPVVLELHNEAKKYDDDNVTRSHVCQKTNGECKTLGKRGVSDECEYY